MSWYTLRTYICNLNGFELTVSAKYRVPDDCKSDAFLLRCDCEIGKGEFKGMSCPIVREQSTCPFEATIPQILPHPY